MDELVVEVVEVVEDVKVVFLLLSLSCVGAAVVGGLAAGGTGGARDGRRVGGGGMALDAAFFMACLRMLSPFLVCILL